MASVRSSVSQQEPGPAWQIAKLFPDQGELSESDYLLLTRRSNRLAEFADGHIEVLPIPTRAHQRIVRYLIGLLMALAGNRGEVLLEHADRNGNEFWDGADLVMEVVSEDDPDRDLQTKRDEYAEAGIPEYWIVDPRTKTVTVLKLDRGQYVTHSEARDVGTVRSSLLDGFTADAAAIFAAAGNA
ncbi:MAG: Uma2 family endonuclease [Tepidisphaeraceae bacterium]